MSRLGKQPIVIAQGVTAELTPDAIVFKGNLGQQSVALSNKVKVEQTDGKIVLTPTEDTQVARTMWGTLRSLMNNANKGVSQGFTQELVLKGVGYKAALNGNALNLSLAFSHEVKYELPQGVKAEIVSPTEIKLTSADKQLLGTVVTEIQKYRKPEPYKGKGIHKKGQYIRRKEGKKK
ncbi:MAG: 50S ribosomal protein L6 [Rickettsiales bacterium]|jgi:large subunit ribosomal protein L6|nr:50S ribosomal protein L6 [Rickettsiales bacterium]